MDPLEDPKTCSRCRRQVPADEPKRPESIRSHVFKPVDPRPTLNGEPVWWEVEADYEEDSSVAALLCAPCVRELLQWIYLPEPLAAKVRHARE